DLRKQFRDEYIKTKGLDVKPRSIGILGAINKFAERDIDAYVDEQMELLRDQMSKERLAIREKEMADNGIESVEQYQVWDRTRDALRNQNTPEEARLLESGQINQYDIKRSDPFYQEMMAD